MLVVGVGLAVRVCLLRQRPCVTLGVWALGASCRLAIAANGRRRWEPQARGYAAGNALGIALTIWSSQQAMPMAALGVAVTVWSRQWLRRRLCPRHSYNTNFLTRLVQARFTAPKITKKFQKSPKFT
jgi:hypothetical protein